MLTPMHFDTKGVLTGNIKKSKTWYGTEKIMVEVQYHELCAFSLGSEIKYKYRKATKKDLKFLNL